ncbi:pyridoxal phosphate enzyme [Methylophaga lonarensis MPL]|uniref:Pyridoxal phosphate homeostasis protein n=1 Tax=Methylophaga lonarensis MPL TaxID=1286106 RepID=M7PRT2_9GAMM|nr:YggS family pyridoxal phosphate-dependent enzyme [Methylophaga lonarensis]EMR13149.1 pyridoxal phosphate enzyme [Methylophaga lonarensis MPL]
MTEIKKRLSTIVQQIRDAEQQAGRPEGSVKLLAVSKTWPAERLRQLAEAGQQAFGENYLQEALDKIEQLADLSIEWHFIGPIQSNKTRDIAGHFQWVHSVDRLKIAQRLNDQRDPSAAPLNICIQINIDEEDTKSGIAADELNALVTAILPLKQLKLRGLMIIPAQHDSDEQQRQSFQKARALFEQLKTLAPDVDTLSMGMSGDMPIAIQEGSTMVRIGTALFGERNRQIS